MDPRRDPVPARPGRIRSPMVLLVPLAVVALAACTGGGAPAGGGTVSVTLQEWAVVADKTSIPAGSVTFDAKNAGPDDPHELVVVKTDLSPLALPTDADGKVLEDGAGVEMIGEIEELEPGKTGSATFDLKSGKYVLICNIYENAGGKSESHYKLGMVLPFTVP